MSEPDESEKAAAAPVDEPDEKELRRRELAITAEPKLALTEKVAALRKAYRKATDDETARRERAMKKLKGMSKEIGAAGTRLAMASRADVQLKSQYVDPEVIKRVSALKQDVWKHELAGRKATEDLRGVHSSVKVMRGRGLAEDTIQRQEKRAEEFEMRAGAEEKLMQQAIDALAPVEAELNAQWDAAREIHVDPVVEA